MEDPLKRFNSNILRINGRTLGWIILGASVVLGFFLLATVYLMGKVSSIEQEKKLVSVVEELQGIKKTQVLGNQYLVSQISYGASKQKVMLFIRDMIASYWESIEFSEGSIERAFTIAKNNVEVSEIYPNIDALLLTAIQFQESRWNVARKSEVGATGLNHIMPSTGALLSEAMGIAFSIKMLLDDRISTEMAAKHLDINYSVYNNWEVALADYNGGPRQATRVLYGKMDEVAPETKKYVPDVLNRWKSYQKQLKTYKADIKHIVNAEVK